MSFSFKGIETKKKKKKEWFQFGAVKVVTNIEYPVVSERKEVPPKNFMGKCQEDSTKSFERASVN
jgi:hypothetical protein